MASPDAQTIRERRRQLTRDFLLALLAAPFVLVGGLVLSYFMFPDEIQWEITDFEVLRTTALFRNGWLPDTMPRSTRLLKGWNNIDSGAVEVEFYINPADLDSLTEGYTELSPDEFPEEYKQQIMGGSYRFRCFKSRDVDSNYENLIAFEMESARVEYRGGFCCP